MGIGIAVENTWPRVLERLIGDCVVHNLAIGGASGDYVVRSIYLADRIVSADMFFVLWPDRSRFEIYQQHVSIHVVY